MKTVVRLLGGSRPAEERMMQIYAFEKKLANVGWDQSLQVTLLFSRKAFIKLGRISQFKLTKATMQLVCNCLFCYLSCFVFLFLLLFFLQAGVGNYYSEDLAEILQLYHRSRRSFDELNNTIHDFCEASFFDVRKIRLNTERNLHNRKVILYNRKLHTSLLEKNPFFTFCDMRQLHGLIGNLGS